MSATLTLTLTATVQKRLKVFRPLELEGGPLAPAVIGVPYSFQLKTLSPAEPGDVWSLEIGSALAPGLALSPGGLVSGTPTAEFDAVPVFVCDRPISVEG